MNRKSAWTFARQCYLDAGGNREQAEALARDRAHREFSSIWVTIVIQIAILLIRLWWENRVSVPEETPGPDCEIFGTLDE